MDFWKSLGGMVRVRLTSADPAAALMAVSAAGITVYDAQRDDADIVADFYIRRSDHKALKALAERKGYLLKTVGFGGIYWWLRQLLRRPVLVFGAAVFCALALYLPSRVFFIRVEGNVQIPTRLILEKCQQSGIYFGASRKDVRSEKVKNALLEALPQLQWAGVNTSGCVATVTVQERSDTEEGKKSNAVCSIVAARDGIITQCTVTRGNSLCKVGQVVRAGDLLVSGYTDCGIRIQATRAEAEIYAQTSRALQVVTPTEWSQQSENTVTEKKYALLIGKKRINFYKGSGISGTSCDKMYMEYYITLPGGFTLPIAIITEVWTTADQTQIQLPEEELEEMLSRFAGRYLPTQMVAGSILSAWENTSTEDGLMTLQGNYACSEMIAQVRSEEILKPNGKYD